MKRFDTQAKVNPGLYFNARKLRFRSLDDPGRLPGDETDRYYRVPLVALLLAGPLVGLVYVIFLPLVGLAMCGAFLVHKLAQWTTEAGTAFARVLRPSWRPVMAFFERTRKGRHQRTRQADQWSEEVKKSMAADADDAA